MKDNNRNDKADASSIPDQNPSKAMDSRKEVADSPDAKTDQDFPGYPHYPAREDIMDQRNDVQRADIDVENLPNSRNVTGVSQRFGGTEGTPAETGTPQNVDNDDLGLREGTEADVSEEERRTLEDATNYRPTQDDANLRQASLDTTDFDGEPLNEEGFGRVRTGVGLDVPDEMDETDTDAMGQGDEENKYYSLGSDRQDQNEEDPYSGPARDSDL